MVAAPEIDCIWLCGPNHKRIENMEAITHTIQSGKGELIVTEVTPAAFKPLARAQVLGGRCWIVPVFADGRLYCRNLQGDLVCLDVKGTITANE